LQAVPSLADLVAVETEDDEDLVDTSGLTPVQQAVLDAIRDGITRTSDIIHTSGRSRRGVYNARDVLIERGLVVEIERGVLGLAPARAARKPLHNRGAEPMLCPAVTATAACPG